jgi:hypothetical protein
MRTALLMLSLLAPIGSLAAQDETTLRRFFEGKNVVAKIDMPATSDGVDVYPDRGMPLEFPKLAARIKEAGIGVKQGQSIMITKVHVKNGLIEFQLGGGGYGTFSDGLTEAAAAPQAPLQFASKREKDLEASIKRETNATVKKGMQNELDDLRRQRNRDNALTTTMNAQTRQAQRANAQDAREHSGSRFNIRYPDGMATSAITPEGVMGVLSKYVTFASDDVGAAAPTAGSQAAPASNATPASGGIGALKKGLSLADVERLLGPASTATKETKGGLEVLVREYESGGQRVSASFVGGVLVDYSIKPAG